MTRAERTAKDGRSDGEKYKPLGNTRTFMEKFCSSFSKTEAKK